MVATRNRAKRTGSQDDDGPSTSQPSSPIRLNSSRKGKRASKPTETPQIHLDEEYIVAPASEVKTDNMKSMIQAASASALLKQEEEPRQHLDSFHRHSQLRSTLDVLLKAVSDPTILLQPNQDLTSSARNSAMAMYKFSLQNLLSSCSKGEAKALKEGPQPVLLELYAGSGFDAEQVWLQLDTATDATLRQVRRLLSRAGIGSGASSVPTSGMVASTAGGPEALVKPEYQEHIDALIQEEEEGGEDEEEEEEDEKEEQLQSLEEDSDHSEEGEEEDDDLDFDEGQEPVQSSGGRRKTDTSRKAGGLKGRSNDEDGFPSDWPHPVEDRFMKLSEMERFLEDAEAKQAQRGGGEGAEEEEQDYLNGEYEGDEGEEDEGEDADGLGGDFDEQEDMDDEDAALEAALMRETAKLAGKMKLNQARGKGVAELMDVDEDDEDEDDEDEDEEGDEDDDEERQKPRKGRANTKGLMYGDFFGGDNVDEGNEDEGNEEDELEEDDEDDDQPDDTTDHQGLMHQAGDGERTSKPIENLSKATKQRMAADMSSHERRMARLQERIVELEKAAVADKEWQLRGEADASRRPLNSALELDLDFETTVKAAPQPTEEATADVEAMIKRRVADHRFDDVIRVVPPPLETRTRTLELDDNKSKKGLGELYEDDFVKAAVGGSAADKDERVRLEAKAIFQALVSKLDALSHFHFAPKPVLEELAVRTDVAAVLMEEAAPVAVSAASMRLPTEVFKAQQEGAPKADGEMSREDRKRKRAQLKRSKKAERARKETERRDKAIALGGVAPVTGRRSAEDAALLAKAGKRARPLQGTESASAAAGKRSEFGKSTAVFGRLQELQDQAKAGAGPGNSKSSRLSDKEPGSVIASGSAFRL